MFRSASAFLLLLFCIRAVPQATSNPVKSFHDDKLQVTYFYPSRFVPVPSPAIKTMALEKPACVRNTLFAKSVTRVDTSSFLLSTIDGTCPDVLHRAIDLGPFVRDQILRQLKEYGASTITQEPTRYYVDGRPAAVTLASVLNPADADKVGATTYAAKACVLGSIPAKTRRKGSPVASNVLCFDFTTQNADVMSQMLSFIIQFDNEAMAPMVPGSALHNR